MSWDFRGFAVDGPRETRLAVQSTNDIDTQPERLKSLIVGGGGWQAALVANEMKLRFSEINAPTKAASMMVSFAADFRTGDWQTPAATLEAPLTGPLATCGAPHLVFLKFQTSDGFESQVGSKEYTVACP